MDDASKKGYFGILLWRYTPVGDDRHLLLKTGNVPPSPGGKPLSGFLNSFNAASSTVAGTTFTPGGTNPFVKFEQKVWDQVYLTIQDIKTAGKMP
jgi:hypothetical protein